MEYRPVWTILKTYCLVCRRKPPTFRDTTTGFPAKWRLRNERRYFILMTRHYPDLGSASDWSKMCLTNEKHYTDLSSEASSVWNFCARFSDVISREEQWWRRETSVLFSGSSLVCIFVPSSYFSVVTGLTPAEFLLASPSLRSLAAFSRVCSSSLHLIFSRSAWNKTTVTVKSAKIKHRQRFTKINTVTIMQKVKR